MNTKTEALRAYKLLNHKYMGTRFIEVQISSNLKNIVEESRKDFKFTLKNYWVSLKLVGEGDATHTDVWVWLFKWLSTYNYILYKF